MSASSSVLVPFSAGSAGSAGSAAADVRGAGSLSDLQHAAVVFDALRPRLFGIAYRMLGSAAEAEDVVQDAWLRWQQVDRATVENPAGLLTTTTTRLALNAAQSARLRRETYVGEWLPEPVDTSADPLLGAERAEALEFAVLRLLEALSPTERAAYVLREAFDYPYSQIAGMLETSEANTRQLVSRAKRHLAAERRARVPLDAQRELLGAFVSAAQTGDMAALEALFAADVRSVSDGGGLVQAVARTVAGRQRVARLVRGAARRFWEGATVEWREVNGQPAVAFVRDGVVFIVLNVVASAEGIEQIHWVLNPEKLGGVQSLATASVAAGAPVDEFSS